MACPASGEGQTTSRGTALGSLDGRSSVLLLFSQAETLGRRAGGSGPRQFDQRAQFRV